MTSSSPANTAEWRRKARPELRKYLTRGVEISDDLAASFNSRDCAGFARYLALDVLIHSKRDEETERAFKLYTMTRDEEDKIAHAMLKQVSGDADGCVEDLDHLARDESAPQFQRQRAVNWRIFAMYHAADPIGLLPVGEFPEVFQYWDAAVPEDVLALSDKWRALAARGGYNLYDDEYARCLIAEEFGGDTIEAYDACWHPAMKSDIFRLAQLYLTGGVYVDADMGPCAETMAMLQRLGGKFTVWMRTNMYMGVFANAVIIAPKRHRQIEYALKSATRNVLAATTNEIQVLTGPKAFTRSLKQYLTTNPDSDLYVLGALQVRRNLAKTENVKYKNDSRSWQVATGKSAATLENTSMP